MNIENIYLNEYNVLVTNARVVINGTNCTLAHITTSTRYMRSNKHNGLIYAGLMAIGMGLMIGGWIFLPFMCLIGLVCFITYYRMKDTYFVSIHTSCGQKHLWACDQVSKADKVIYAINMAIINQK